jgi:hypothetical protein
MKLATLPDSANRPKASVARSGVVWRTIIVRLAACSVPPAAPISAPQEEQPGPRRLPAGSSAHAPDLTRASCRRARRRRRSAPRSRSRSPASAQRRSARRSSEASDHRRHRADDAEDADLADATSPARPRHRRRQSRKAHSARRDRTATRQQIGFQAAAKPQRGQQSLSCSTARPRCTPCGAVGSGLLHPKKEGHHEDDVPDRGEGADGAGALARLGVQAEGWVSPERSTRYRHCRR